jgi:hypothetical protein
MGEGFGGASATVPDLNLTHEGEVAASRLP